MNRTSQDIRFASLGSARNIWVVPAIHAEHDRLAALHDDIYRRFMPGDRLVYTGNYTGYGLTSRETINEILTFRRILMAIPGIKAEDIIYLRGGQEEMWQKLLQIHFAPDPHAILRWMLNKGMAPTLLSYNIDPEDGLMAAMEGVVSLTRWTGKIRDSIRRNAGHETFGTQLKRAAYMPYDTAHPMLFVHAGINPAHPLSEQGDSFWWAGGHFDRIESPYAPFKKVVRGFDPEHKGTHVNCITATIDGGCGFGGTLQCAGFAPNGEVFEMLEA